MREVIPLPERTDAIIRAIVRNSKFNYDPGQQIMPPMRYSETISSFDSRCFGVGIRPHKARGGLGGIVHEMVLIGPNDGDEKVAHRIAEPRWPEREKRLEGRNLRGPQFQSTVMRTAKTPSEKTLNRSGVLLPRGTAVIPFLPSMFCGTWKPPLPGGQFAAGPSRRWEIVTSGNHGCCPRFRWHAFPRRSGRCRRSEQPR
jgi:hypothetical protein